jgi:hypothetical protein
MMKEIYRNAENVIVWLGEGTWKATEARDWLLYHLNDIMWVNRIGPPSMPVVVDRLAELLRSSYRARRGLGAFMTDILARPWWERVWVIQEVAVASSIVVYCGRTEIRWDEMAQLVIPLQCGQ